MRQAREDLEGILLDRKSARLGRKCEKVDIDGTRASAAHAGTECDGPWIRRLLSAR